MPGASGLVPQVLPWPHPVRSCWEFGSAPVDGAPAGAGHCKAAVTVSAVVFWNPGSLLLCELRRRKQRGSTAPV